MSSLPLHQQDVVVVVVSAAAAFPESTIELIMNREPLRTRQIRRLVSTIILSFLVTLWGVNIHSFVTETHRYTNQIQQPQRRLNMGKSDEIKEYVVQGKSLVTTTPASQDRIDEPNTKVTASPLNKEQSPFWLPEDNNE